MRATSSQAPEWKARKVEELARHISANKVLAVASLQKVRAIQLQKLRKTLSQEVKFVVVKNRLVERALKRVEAEKPGITRLERVTSGSNIYLLTHMNPVKLNLLLGRNKMRIAAKAGDVAQEDIVVSAGNTGLQPGPVISELTELGLPTRIETGSVWITRDTTVARKGEAITPKLASVLSKLGMKPLEAGLSIVEAYDEGSILTAEQLRVDLEEIKREVMHAQLDVMTLSIEACFPTETTIAMILSKAHREATQLAVASNFMDAEFIQELIRKAHLEGVTLNSKIKAPGAA